MHAPRLPSDCLEYIFDYLTTRQSLRSAGLVNKEWNATAMPILWSSTFASINPKIIPVYIKFLPHEVRTKLKLEDESFHKSTTMITKLSNQRPIFDYAACIHHLDFYIIYMSAVYYYHLLSNESARKFFEGRKVCIKSALLARELIQMFIKRSRSIRTLVFVKSRRYALRPVIFSPIKIEITAESLRNLRFLSFSGCSNLLQDMAKVCTQIEQLAVRNINANINKDVKALGELIAAQTRLTCLSITNTNCETLATIMKESLLTSHKTLKIVSLSACDIGEKVLNWLANCENLVKLTLDKCRFNELPKSFQLSMESFSKLNELRVLRYGPPPEIFCSLLKNSNSSLRVLSLPLNGNLYPNNLLHIANSCPNLEWLSTEITYSSFPQIQTLFKKCRKLKALQFIDGEILESFEEETEEIMIEDADGQYLKNLAPDVPPSMTDFAICTRKCFISTDVNDFLKNISCKLHTFRYLYYGCIVEHLSAIDDYANSIGKTYKENILSGSVTFGYLGIHFTDENEEI
ncbi:3980_t:CDS:1 [Ambispora gerdemannii]|uniref:3980_t:CDS:1 n=1 Tax=Ambispora gerdemannii TaxID=144530 RepID=A0A9N9GI09_9GLOM|nr:3980_t:CDS:1 [Ambispora gerdemannii]